MGLNGVALSMMLVMAALTHAHANGGNETKPDFYTATSIEVSEVSRDALNMEVSKVVSQKNFQQNPYSDSYDDYSQYPGLPSYGGQLDPLDKAGKVIKYARDIVALGEDFYRLVIKGKPSVATKYAPISVVPKIDGQPADPLETENWQIPRKVTYDITFKNPYGITVIKFRYSVIWSWGGSYNGTGRYITGAQVIPESAFALYGYDFTATMKLGGIQNNATRNNPLAGATLMIEYTYKTIVKAANYTDSFFVLGDGTYKKL